MDAKERVLGAIHGGPIDRVPLVPYISQFACCELGVNYTRFCKEASVLAETLMACRDRFGYDVLYVSTDSCMEVEAMGCPVRYFEDDVPTVAGHPWAGQDLGSCCLSRPDPDVDGRMPVYAEAVRRMVEATADTVPVICGSDGPLTIISHFRGLTEFLLDLLDEPDACKELLKEAAEVSLSFNLANLRAGATICHMGDPEACLLSPALYRELVWPAHRLIVEGIQSAGGKVLGHFCGNTAAILPDLVDLGCDILNVDNQIGLEQVKAYADRVCLLGDLPPVEVLKNGTPESLKEAICGRMNLLKSSRHYMLGSGCHFPADTPSENVAAFVKYGLEFGRYEDAPC